MSPASHQVLLVDEILRIIIDALVTYDWARPTRDGYDRASRQRALFNLALTCRALSEPASDALWEAFFDGNVWTLIRIGGFRRLPPGPNWPVTLPNSGPLIADDWPAFRRCAARVHQIGYWSGKGSNKDLEIRPSVWEMLADKLGGETLFPRLKTLSWRATYREAEVYRRSRVLRVLVSPSVTTLCSAQANWWPKLRRDLSIIAERCPHLQAIDVRHMSSLDAVSLAACRALRRIEVATLTDSALSCLAHLAHLDALLCRHLKPFEHPEPPPLWPSRAFPRLRAFSLLVCPPPADLAPLWAALAAAPCAAATLPTPAPLPALCAPHARFGASLRALTLALAPAAPLAPALAPLYDLRALESLRVDAPIASRDADAALVLADADVGRMARAWPALVHLRLCEQLAPASERAPSVLALVGLAEHCRALEAALVNVADVSEAEIALLEERAGGGGQRQLVQWRLAGARWAERLKVADAGRLARAVSALFPALEGDGVLCAWERRETRYENLPTWRGATRNTAAYAFLLELDRIQAGRRSGRVRS
ncbi:uncharacterized protein BXZ73DRAFT_108167 [Epithele typhae]|uniref:uncharacterized protein n=1 Tax=Epithele typhae TaxID=378194 RepID=UPI002007AFC5|nr:uncharacterized protein BXZ73DRAFT_108167 [Epithele typhae]KAH9911215.1 hypothetical protein BXZ73DRAFT_108167 [Epithele typhae]